MPLALHDTLSRAKRPFEPADPKRVTLYVCGPTVYNYAHIGNARPVVVFDVLYRLLRRLYGEDAVVYARNITDVDDKINAAATEQGVDISVITDRFAAVYAADMASLNALPPTHEPRATGHITEMSRLIETMVQRGLAYVSEGEVLFDVGAYDAGSGRYAALSGRSLDEMIAGARVEVAGNKHHPADFVLWKPSKAGEPEWTGPLGLKGRPGWHIECSAMAEKALGLPVDIHGGGHDLIFPHHTNEIAQSCAAHGSTEPRDYARTWMHNGFLDFSGEKMSKSLGNVVLVHDLAKAHPGEVLRWALLSGHYRAPLDWTDELIQQSRKSLDRLYGALRRSADIPAAAGEPPAAFMDALLDDLATPRALAELFALAKTLETSTDGGERRGAKAALLGAGRLLGFLEADPEAWFEGGAGDDLKSRVEALLAERLTARQAKDWATADRIRDELNALNVVVMDGPAGATWRLGGSDPQIEDAMPFKVEHRVGVPASSKAIWDVLSDLPRWKEWNTLYPQIEGLLRIQQRLTVTEAFPGRSPRVINPVVGDWVPNAQIIWLWSEMGGLVKHVRYIEIESLNDEDANCILSNGEIYDGWLGNMVGNQRRRWLKKGFEQLNNEIVERLRQVKAGAAVAEGDRG